MPEGGVTESGQTPVPTPQGPHPVPAARRGQPASHVPACLATHTFSYPSSFFVPGRVGGWNLTFPVDTGCMHNMLSRTVFNRLPRATRHKMRLQETTAAMADGSGSPRYDSIFLVRRLCNVRFAADFLVCSKSDDGILGMSFLKEQDC